MTLADLTNKKIFILGLGLENQALVDYWDASYKNEPLLRPGFAARQPNPKNICQRRRANN